MPSQKRSRAFKKRGWWLGEMMDNPDMARSFMKSSGAQQTVLILVGIALFLACVPAFIIDPTAGSAMMFCATAVFCFGLVYDVKLILDQQVELPCHVFCLVVLGSASSASCFSGPALPLRSQEEADKVLAWCTAGCDEFLWPVCILTTHVPSSSPPLPDLFPLRLATRRSKFLTFLRSGLLGAGLPSS